MTPAAILKQARADGLTLSLTGRGTVLIRGPQPAAERWKPALRECKAELLALLQSALAEIEGGETPIPNPARATTATQAPVALPVSHMSHMSHAPHDLEMANSASWDADDWQGYMMNGRASPNAKADYRAMRPKRKPGSVASPNGCASTRSRRPPANALGAGAAKRSACPCCPTAMNPTAIHGCTANAGPPGMPNAVKRPSQRWRALGSWSGALQTPDDSPTLKVIQK